MPVMSWLAERTLAPADVWSEAELSAEREKGRAVERQALLHAAARWRRRRRRRRRRGEAVAGYYSAEAATTDDWTARFRSAARLSLAEINERTCRRRAMP